MQPCVCVTPCAVVHRRKVFKHPPQAKCKSTPLSQVPEHPPQAKCKSTRISQVPTKHQSYEKAHLLWLPQRVPSMLMECIDLDAARCHKILRRRCYAKPIRSALRAAARTQNGGGYSCDCFNACRLPVKRFLPFLSMKGFARRTSGRTREKGTDFRNCL